MTVRDAHAGFQYRPDIDGLRAFAVLSVVLFHAFPQAIPGGFVGVDIFFVISGYLISGIVLKELDQGSFSFAGFYARRIKRIFPALLIVLISSFIAGWFLLFDDEFLQLSNHELRATVFLSNFMLWHESGYFDNVAATKPLLHLWSLAIEEQFYLVWPLMAWSLWKARLNRYCWMAIAACWLLSLGWNIHIARIDLTHDFYSPLTRFWELLSGSLLAYATSSKFLDSVPSSAMNEQTRGRLGMTLLLISVFVINESRAFPGGWALLPVVGAVLLISANHRSDWVRYFFGNRWVVFVGLISYPLYLWHWPVLSFMRIVEGATPSPWLRVVGVWLSLLLAWLTYVAVERPIRFTWRWKFKTQALLLLMVLLGLGSYAAKRAEGFPQRSVMASSNVLLTGDIGHDAFHNYYKAHLFPCADAEIQKDAGIWLDVVRCFQTQPNGPIDSLLLGDSHAEHLLAGLAAVMPERNIAFYGKGALPFLSSPEFKLIFQKTLSDPNIREVWITAYWSGRWNDRASARVFEEELKATLKAFIQQGKKVVLIGDTPKFPFDPQRCKYKRPMSSGSQCTMPMSEARAQHDLYWPSLQAVQKALPEVRLLGLEGVFCSTGSCTMALNGVVMFRDRNHLNISGSRRVGSYIVEAIH